MLAAALQVTMLPDGTILFSAAAARLLRADPGLRLALTYDGATKLLFVSRSDSKSGRLLGTTRLGYAKAHYFLSAGPFLSANGVRHDRAKVFRAFRTDSGLVIHLTTTVPPPQATIYKIGSVRLSAGAAEGLGHEHVDEEYFRRPPIERQPLPITLKWCRSSRLLTIRGGDGPYRLHVYPRAGTLPYFLIIASAFFRQSIGLRVPAARRFALVEIEERALTLNRDDPYSIKVSRRRRRGRPYGLG